jgi:hypothetical protein
MPVKENSMGEYGMARRRSWIPFVTALALLAVVAGCGEDQEEEAKKAAEEAAKAAEEEEKRKAEEKLARELETSLGEVFSSSQEIKDKVTQKNIDEKRDELEAIPDGEQYLGQLAKCLELNSRIRKSITAKDYDTVSSSAVEGFQIASGLYAVSFERLDNSLDQVSEILGKPSGSVRKAQKIQAEGERYGYIRDMVSPLVGMYLSSLKALLRLAPPPTRLSTFERLATIQPDLREPPMPYFRNTIGAMLDSVYKDETDEEIKGQMEQHLAKLKRPERPSSGPGSEPAPKEDEKAPAPSE